MMMLFCFALSWAIVRAFEQMGSDARTGARDARARYQRRVRNTAKLRAQRIRARGWRHPERWALAAGVGTSVLARTTVRGARHAGRSATTGWAKGWAEGKTRHVAYVDRRGERRAAAQKGAIDGDGELHFGVDPDDPNGVRVCGTCRGRAVVGRPPRSCPECVARQHRRNDLHAENEAARSEAARQAGEAGPRRTLRVRDEEPGFVDHMRAGEFDPDTETPDHPAGQTGTPTGDGGTPVSIPNGQAPTGEATNIETARQALQALARIGEQANTAADQLSASLASADMDADTLGEVSAVLEAADSLKTAASAAQTGLDRRHQVMEEAVNSTPHAARTDFYRH